LRIALLHLIVVALISPLAACHHSAPAPTPTANGPHIKPFNFQITEGSNDYQIEGYLAEDKQRGRLPAMLVLNGEKGNARIVFPAWRRWASGSSALACRATGNLRGRAALSAHNQSPPPAMRLICSRSGRTWTRGE
jgi:hypothetical protein